MTKKKAGEKLANKLEKKYGRLFDGSGSRVNTNELSKDDQKLLDGGCIIEGGQSVCRIDNVWIVC